MKHALSPITLAVATSLTCREGSCRWVFRLHLTELTSDTTCCPSKENTNPSIARLCAVGVGKVEFKGIFDQTKAEASSIL
jgi:hypothetical protein